MRPLNDKPLTDSVDTTNQRFEDEVPSTAVVNMSQVSEACLSPQGVPCRPTSQPTLRVEALSSGNLSAKLVSLARINLTFQAEVQNNGTHTVNLHTNSNARSGTGCNLVR